MKENSFDSGTPAFDVVLAQTIARHFRGATTETIDDAQTVRLGEGLPTIECFIDEIQDHEPYGAFLFLQISGGAFGSRPVLVTASGYGSSQLASVVTAGCNWACAFGPVLLTGVGRPDLIDSDNPDVEQFEATVGGRRYRVATGHLDRSMNMPIEEVEAYRRRLGGPRALTDRVPASPLIPATRSNEAVALGCYAGIGPHSITELKLAGADWPAGRSVLDAIPPEPGGHRMLREWSVLTPLEPAPPLTRDGLQHILDLIAVNRPGLIGGLILVHRRAALTGRLRRLGRLRLRRVLLTESRVHSGLTSRTISLSRSPRSPRGTRAVSSIGGRVVGQVAARTEIGEDLDVPGTGQPAEQVGIGGRVGRQRRPQVGPALCDGGLQGLVRSLSGNRRIGLMRRHHELNRIHAEPFRENVERMGDLD